MITTHHATLIMAVVRYRSKILNKCDELRRTKLDFVKKIVQSKVFMPCRCKKHINFPKKSLVRYIVSLTNKLWCWSDKNKSVARLEKGVLIIKKLNLRIIQRQFSRTRTLYVIFLRLKVFLVLILIYNLISFFCWKESVSFCGNFYEYKPMLVSSHKTKQR